MIVVDTNVLSEMLKDNPNAAVVKWYGEVRLRNCFVTAITQAEMLAGAKTLPEGKRRRNLLHAISGLFEQDFVERILAFDTRAAGHYAEIVVQRRRLGKPIKSLDAQIAAIAREARMTIATRNMKDFADCGIDLIDPWAA